MTDLTTPFCPECGHVKHVAGCPETRAMTDLEALAKLATEATPGLWHAHRQPRGSPWWIESEDEHSVADAERAQDAAYIAAASPDVVLALVRVALVARALTYPALHSWACVDSESGCVCRDAPLRAALADLGR